MSGPFRFFKRMSRKSKNQSDEPPTSDKGSGKRVDETESLSAGSASLNTPARAAGKETKTVETTIKVKPEKVVPERTERGHNSVPKPTAAETLGQGQDMDGHQSAFTTVDQELSRMRTELSRATFTCERREMEAARADADLRHYQEDLARISALKTECDNENRKLQTEVASLERERARLVAEIERYKEHRQRVKSKLADKKSSTVELRAQLKEAQEAREQLERTAREREQTWQTIRRDVTSRRDDAIKDSCKVRRENEKLKLKIKRLKMEKSNILIRVWEKKQLQSETGAQRLHSDIKGSDQSINIQRPVDESQQAKILSLELQLFRQARLVELLLDVIQAQDPQFTIEERKNLVSAFADAGSIPELLSRKFKFS